MKLMINLIAALIAASVPAQTAGTNQTVETELRNSATVGNRMVWDAGFNQYLAVHQIYVCRVIQPPNSTDDFKRWQFEIDRTIRGDRTGKLLCELPGETKEVKVGTRLIVLGNEHKTGFNLIGWWFHSAETEKAIGALTQGGSANPSQPVGPGTNRTPPAADSGG